MTDRKLIIDTPFWKDLYAGEDPAFDPERASDLFAQIPEFARLANFTAEELEKLSVELEKIAADPEQFRFWDLYRRTIMQEGTAGGDPAAIELKISSPHVNPHAIRLAVLLACIPDYIALYKEKDWYDPAFSEALLDIRIWMDFCAQNYNGAFGIADLGFAWIRAQIHGLVIRFGRLQCNTPTKFFNYYRVFRNRESRQLQALMNDDFAFDRNGMTALTPEDAAFHSAPVEETAGTVSGYGVSPDGLVSAEKITLDKSHWEEVLRPGDTVINLHIPADGPLDVEACRASCRRMKDFYVEKLGVEPKAFVCESWLLDPMFSRLMPADSNILAFQRMGYLLPWPGASELVVRVFGVNGIDAVPHNTRMRKIFAEFIREGGRTRNGAFFFFPEDL